MGNTLPKYKKDRIGDKFGEWVVIDSAPSKKNQTYWRCQCSCGFIKDIATSNIVQNNTSKCRKCSILTQDYGVGKTNRKYKGYKDLSSVYFSRIKIRAKNANMEFDVDIIYLFELFEKQNKKCNLSGLDIVLDSCARMGNTTASLDRIDSSKGYIKGNVQWLHIDVNKMKVDLDQDCFVNWCKIITSQNNTNV